MLWEENTWDFLVFYLCAFHPVLLCTREWCCLRQSSAVQLLVLCSSSGQQDGSRRGKKDLVKVGVTGGGEKEEMTYRTQRKHNCRKGWELLWSWIWGMFFSSFCLFCLLGKKTQSKSSLLYSSFHQSYTFINFSKSIKVAVNEEK